MGLPITVSGEQRLCIEGCVRLEQTLSVSVMA